MNYEKFTVKNSAIYQTNKALEIVRYNPGETTVALVHNSNNPNQVSNQEETAKLLAAAPQMLNALIIIDATVGLFAEDLKETAAMDTVRAAIKAAQAAK